LLSCGIFVCSTFYQAIPGAAAQDPSVRGPAFETDVQPLLLAKCLRCHGDKGRKGELDLRTLASVLKGGESGAVVVPGQPEKSLLYEKVRDGLMPPGKKDRLNEAEREIIRRWIEQGARGRVAGQEARPAWTQHDVIPILLRRCTVCHGARQREGGLDLRTKAALLRGGKSGPAIVPGKPEASLLLKKIRAGEMPPLRRLVEVSIKPIEPAETELLAQWIAQGAPEAPAQSEDDSPESLITDRDRSFWAFQAPRPVSVPVVRHAAQVRNPIDAFILQKLEPLGLSLSAEADRATLMRRAYLDVTGLPPEPAEVEAFLASRDPLAYEKMIDGLLASPRYGERWGRHWLDAAGYADSEGKREQDLLRPHAYRYRDYVIRALNADKPYNRFLLEQIAGDELADYEHGPITPEIYDNLVATGFLRMAPDPTWYNLTNFIPDRLEVIGDEIEVLSSAVMGLTMKCARCHSHKFDPIPQRDYYRLADIFKGAFDEYDWMKSTWDNGLSMGPRTDRDLPYVSVAERRQWETEGRPKKLPEPKIRALWDRGEPSPTYMYRRGDYLSPGNLVGPGVPAVLTDGKTALEVKPPWPGARKTGRRLAFARWLTRPENPLTARVYVNRVWKHHFGAGIVKSLANFGKAGSPPTHPEFLDWLSRELVRQGWSTKALHRLMLTSATYRQSSLMTPEPARLDPHNALFSRMPLRRMDAEVLYDTLLLAAGRLDERRYGPADPVEGRKDGLVTPVGSERGWRRSVYVQQQRKQMATIFENFDLPQMNPNCIERRDANVAPQALHLMNNAMIHKLADHFAARVGKEVGNDPGRQIERVYLIALGRLPDHEERTIAAEALAALTRQWTLSLPHKASAKQEEPAQRALATFCHTMLNSAGFLYID
jgi:mono/diheme cytochrome c family protein